jgi:ATP-dependent protease ClpP protease subunit
MLKRLHDQLCDILAERSTLDKNAIKRRSQDKDWWMSAAEAIEFGFFDGYDE